MLSSIGAIIIAVVTAIVAMALWHTIFGTSTLNKEIDRNDHFPAPDDRQLKWHIQHMRQDIISITRILYLIFIILLIMLIRDFVK